MSPTLPSSCDECHKPLDKALKCGRCKASVYCSKECQVAHWKAHKTNCSAVPAGPLVPKRPAIDREMCTEAETIQSLLSQVAMDWMDKSVATGIMAGSGPADSNRLTPHQRGSLLLSPEFKQLVTYRLSARFAPESYPGRARPRRDDAAHRLVLLQRFLFLHHLSHTCPAGEAVWLKVFDPANSEYNGPAPDDPHRARLHGPKLLAAPDQLSAGEYASITSTLGESHVAVGPGDHAQAWILMDQVGQQCGACHELLAYAPELGAQVGSVPDLKLKMGRYGEPGAPERPW